MRADRLLLTLAGAALLASCSKKPPEISGTQTGVYSPVEVPLQVAALSPSSVEANQAATVTVVGAGFLAGAAVRVGEQFIDRVAFVDENRLEVQLPPMPSGSYDVTVANTDANESTLRSALSVRGAYAGAACGYTLLYFALNQAGLNAEARAELDRNLPCYGQSGGPITIEGHADERGTTDYNLALGQRRAEAVARHLGSGGVSRSRITTLSMGEERPADPAHNETAWAHNRRVEIRYTQ